MPSPIKRKIYFALASLCAAWAGPAGDKEAAAAINSRTSAETILGNRARFILGELYAMMMLFPSSVER
jgi:hypothetical protein